MSQCLDRIKEASKQWVPPVVPEHIPQGDMPGDKIEIGPEHIAKANKLFPSLLEQLEKVLEQSPCERAVLTVCGGSGVGKSETASLLTYYFNQMGIGSYTMSGDNYPNRIPKYNDAERLRIYRKSGMKGLVQSGEYTEERFALLQEWQRQEQDANPKYGKEHPWFTAYYNAGKEGLEEYLGTFAEIDFAEVSGIVKEFKAGAEKIWLKRMGRDETELWYSQIDFSNINVLVIEWTHGNSDNYEGVDIPILLNSTPQETLAHRKARNRDGKTDSPFTTLVLEVEQGMLRRQAHKAKLILSKAGELLSYEEYCKIMEESEAGK